MCRVNVLMTDLREKEICYNAICICVTVLQCYITRYHIRAHCDPGEPDCSNCGVTSPDLTGA